METYKGTEEKHPRIWPGNQLGKLGRPASWSANIDGAQMDLEGLGTQLKSACGVTPKRHTQASERKEGLVWFGLALNAETLNEKGKERKGQEGKWAGEDVT